MIGKVIRVDSKGLSAQLRDGSDVFVPRKELSWSRENRSPFQLFKTGDLINVVQLTSPTDSQGEIYSIRKTSPDPWISRAPRYTVGQNVVGKVISIFEDAIFIEIEEGVAGRVSIHEIGPSALTCSSESVSLGDHIRVRIKGKSDEHRNFICSNTQALEDNKKSPSIKKATPGPISQIGSTDKPAADSYGTGSISVLLIDDDRSFCVSTKRAFELSGHSLQYTTDPENGISLAIEGDYDIVVIDLIMPNLHGIDVFRRIQEVAPDIPMVIFTGEATIGLADFAGLLTKPLVLHKPFEIADVEAACFQKVSSNLQLVPEIKDRAVEKVVLYDSITQNKNSDNYVVDQIQAFLPKVNHTIYGVFKWIDYDQRLQYLNGSGFKPGANLEQMERQLFYSPLRSIAEDMDIVYTSCVSECSESFKSSFGNLYPFVQFFESLYCAPIVVQGKTRYVILYAHTLPDELGSDPQEYIKDKHAVIASELAVREAYKQTEALQKLALRGELTASLAHEIRNRLHILSMNMKALKKLGPRAEHKLRQDKSHIPKELGELNEILDVSQTAMDRINEVVTSFSEYIAEKGYSSFNFTELLKSVESRLRLVANKMHVPIYLEGNSQCMAKGSPSRLGQVIENLILNGLQHTAILRSKNGSVYVKYGREDNLNLFFVEISDDGEGIHAKDYNRIFEMGFTTKETGSGVGLALCSATMRSLKGRVFVKESILFEGTTMRIEWPTEEEKSERN